MRFAKWVFGALLLVACMGQDFGGGALDGDGPADALGGSTSVVGESAWKWGGVAPFPLASSCEFVLDAADIDGDGTFNAAYAHADAVGTWVNQGTALPASATTTNDAYRPRYCSTCANGLGAISFGGVAHHMVLASSTTTAAFVSDSADFEIVAIYTQGAAKQRYVIGNTNSGIIKGWSLLDGLTNRNGSTFFITNGTTTNLNFTSTQDNGVGDFNVIDIYASGVGSGLFGFSNDWASYNTGSPSGTLHTGSLSANIYIGHYTSTTSAGWDGEIAFFAVCDGKLSADDRATVKAWADGRYGPDWGNLDAANTVAWLGDSITAFAPSRGEVPPPQRLELLANASTYTTSVGNNALGGWTISQCQTEYTNAIDPFTEIGVLVIWCGVNDIIAGTAGATAFTAWEAIVDDAITDGMTVVAITNVPFANYSSWSAAKQTEQEAFNAAVTAKSGVLHVNAYTLLQDPLDTDAMLAAYDSGDGLHPNQAGSDVVAAAVQSALGL